MAEKHINDLISAINKSFGDGSITCLGDDPSLVSSNADRLKTNLFSLDIATNGGLVKGGFTEIFGSEGDGKTTLALHILAQAQKLGMNGYFLDAEHKLNIDYANTLGVDTDKLLITQPPYGEKALDVMQSTLQSGLIDICIVDSVSALVPLVDINGDFSDANIGAHARLMSKMCRVLNPIVSDHKVVFILINQVRMKIGQMFGNPETTTGGRAIPFYAGQRMKLTSSQVKTGGVLDTSKRDVNVTLVKNQWGRPYTKCSLRLNLGFGFDTGLDIIMAGLEKKILTLASSSVKYEDTTLGNGKQNAGDFIMKDEKLKNKILEDMSNVV